MAHALSGVHSRPDTSPTLAQLSTQSTQLMVWSLQTLDRQKGTDVVNAACEACKASIEERKGRLVVRASARAVSERDDRLLTDQMKV